MAMVEETAPSGTDGDAPDPPAFVADDGAGGPPLLDPTTISLRRGPTGAVRMSTDVLTHLRVDCYRAFPLSAPEEWIAFFDGGGKHIGILADLSSLDPASAAICREELELRYVVPAVRRVLAVREEFVENRWNPALLWDVETERGPLRLHLPNMQDHVRSVGPGRLLLTDRDGRRCLLETSGLTGNGRGLVERYLWLDPQS